MLDQNCAYCMKGDLVAKFGYFCCEMESSNVYIFKEQSHPGRVIVAHKKHVSEIIELTDEERNQFFKDINTVSNAIHKVFNPDKVNYGAYGDTGHHLHFHSASDAILRPGFIRKTPFHSKSSLYLGTKWK